MSTSRSNAIAQRKAVLKQIKEFIASWNHDFNLPDVLISPLYLESLKLFSGRPEHAGIKSRIRNFLFNVRLYAQGTSRLPIRTNQTFEVILYPSTIAHLRQMIPVAEKLQVEGIGYCWVVTKKQLGIELQAMQQQPVIIEGLYGVNFLSLIRLKKLIKKSVPLADANRLSITWRKVMLNNAARFLSTVNLFNAIAGNFKPGMLLVGNDLTFEGRTAARVFNNQRIFTASIQHGDVSGMLESEHIVNEFFVYGEVARDLLSEINRGTVFTITGSPFMDRFNANRTLHPAIADSLNLNDYYVLIAFSGAGNNTSIDHLAMQIEAVEVLARQLPDIPFVIKLHPKDRAEHYEKRFLHKLPNVRLVPPDSKKIPTSIFDWLSGSRLVITGASTTAIEAMSMEILVLAMDFLNEYSDISFIRENAVILSTGKSEFICQATSAIANPERYSGSKLQGLKYAANYFYKDQKIPASQLIASRILSKLR